MRQRRRPQKIEEEPEEVELQDDEMAWQSIFVKHEQSEPMVCIFWGLPGSGKTRLALEVAAGPVYLVETEGGHNFHTLDKYLLAHAEDDEQKDIYRCKADAVDPDATLTMKWFSGGGESWFRTEKIFRSLQHAPEGTVIIDSGSDLLPTLISAFNIDWSRGDKAFPPKLYGQCYSKLRSEINLLRDRHNIIITAQETEKYDRRSEEPKVIGTEMSLWNKAEYLAEHTIRVIDDGDGNRIYRVKENKSEWLSLDSITWDELRYGFAEEKKDASRYKKQLERFAKGKAALETAGIEYTKQPPSSLEELTAEVESMLATYKQSQNGESTSTGSSKRRRRKNG